MSNTTIYILLIVAYWVGVAVGYFLGFRRGWKALLKTLDNIAEVYEEAKKQEYIKSLHNKGGDLNG